MHKTTIMLPESLKKRAEVRAGEIQVSLGELVRNALENYLVRQETNWESDPLAAGDYLITAPAPAKVSENIDRYIYGKKS